MKKRIGIIIVALTGFGAILFFVLGKETLVFDTVIRQWFYSLRSEPLTAVLKVITYMGNWQSISLLCLILLIFKSTRVNFGVPVSIVAIFVTIFNKLIKYVVQRPRPDVSLHLIEQGGFSFTSGHSITSMAVFGILIFLVRKYVTSKKKANILTAVLIIPLIFIGLSRIYMGVHYPTDVLAGWCLGITVVMVASMAIDQREKSKL